MFASPRFSHATLALSLSCSSSAALAGYQFEYENMNGEVTLGAGAGSISSNNINFGSGRVDQRSGKNTGSKAFWQEAFLKPGITLDFKATSEIDLLAGGSVIGAATWGDGDAGGYSRSSDGNVAVEELYAGFRAGELTFTAGRQNYMVGTGFIVMDGHLDEFKDGAYFLAPRTAFRDSAVLGIDHDTLKMQAFTLKTDDHFGDFRLNGINLDYSANNWVTLGAMVMKVNAPYNSTTTRDGMEVYNLRALNGKFPALPALTLNGEYAIQRGDGAGYTYNAYAWYTQADYALDSLPLKPTLGYRYATFSGDDNLNDNQKRSWDSLSKGYIGWGTWLIGDVVGNYLLFNSNQRVQQFSLKTQLTDTLTLGGIYYQFWLDKPNYYGTPVSDRRFADEYALYLDWTPTPAFYTSLSYNWVKPKRGAEQIFNGKRDFNTLELYFTYRY
ncbi:alginate export family protein (plasmid) [Klebsiella sp. B345]|uniref:alginate export family protein n=1 Tax=Klebsiella sp. B345 TaxID=2755398 RepID=UPI003DA93B0E